MPEVMGIANADTPEGAVAWTCANEAIVVRDVEVERLGDESCWYQDGPHTFQ